MTNESPPPSSDAEEIARNHAAAILALGTVSTKFQQPLETLQLRKETCEAVDEKSG